MRFINGTALIQNIHNCFPPSGTFNDDREGGLRLTGREANSSAGAVEIFFKGRWNRICSVLFKQTAADVACRQLGYSGAIGFYDDGRYVCMVCHRFNWMQLIRVCDDVLRIT